MRPPLLSLSGAPTVYLLDAHQRGRDEKQLRAEARRLTAQLDAPFSSRSYRYPYALVACHGREVGVDVEVVEDANMALVDVICTEAERRLLVAQRDLPRCVSSLWSAKEALAKALGDALRYEPGRLCSPLVWPPEQSSTGRPVDATVVAAGRWRATALKVPDSYVGWLCWVPYSGSSLTPYRS